MTYIAIHLSLLSSCFVLFRACRIACGFFLALPSVFSLECLLAGVTVLVRQARVEEKALAELFGEAYEAYRRQVPRWL